MFLFYQTCNLEYYISKVYIIQLTVSSGMTLSDTNISVISPLADNSAGVGDGASGNISLVIE